MACVTKKRGKWAVDFYDHHGKRRLKVLPKGSTKAQARKLLREIEKQVERRTFIPSAKVPQFSKVAKQWLKYKKPNLRASTWSVYEGHTRNHFNDFDDLKINLINTARIEEFITDRQLEGMNILTLRKILVTLNQILAYAVRHGYIDYNPLRDAERPRGQGAVEDKPIRILAPDGINAFLDAVDDPKYNMLFRLAIMSGARQGELLGLKWSDIDWGNHQIHIKRTYNNQAWYAPKSKTSIRNIDIGPSTMTALKRWRLKCPITDLDLVFPNEAGQPINHNNMINRYFNKGLEDAELETIRFHDLRHTYASLLIEQGENIKYIQTQLGHSSPTVTLNVYAHLMKDTNQGAARGLEKAVFGASGDQMETKMQQGATTHAVTP
jgi:integrase